MLNLLAIPSVIALGGMNVALVDLVVLAVLLIALIVGLAKGFVRQIFSLLGGIAALVVAIFTCEYVADFLSTSIPRIPESISAQLDSLLGLDGVLLQGTKEQILESLSSTTIPVFLHELIANTIVDSVGELNLTVMLTGYVMIAIAFIVVFLLSLIVFSILKKIFSALTNVGVLGAIDRILGMIFSIAVALAVLIVICIVLSLIIPNINDFLVPVTEAGEKVTCHFNTLLTNIMNLDVIKNLLASIVPAA